MIFSKSFGYAVRSVLYIVKMQDTRSYIQVEEIAEKLAVPRHFVSKVLKKLVKAGVLASSKGKTGGFAMNESTTFFQLLQLYELIDGVDMFRNCSLRMQECTSKNPCPLHKQMEEIKRHLLSTLAATSILDLANTNDEDFIQSIATKKIESGL